MFKNPYHLRFLREKSRLTQQEVSTLLANYTNNSVTNMAISRHETTTENAFRHPQMTQLKAYAHIYKVPVRCLYTRFISEDELDAYIAESQEQ